MKKNVKPLTPRCGICKRLYSSKDDDGSGLCLKCRSANSQAILAVKHQLKQIIVTEVGRTMIDDFDKEEMQEQEVGYGEVEQNQVQSEIPDNVASVEEQVITESHTGELKIEDIIQPGRYGITNSQMIPVLKKAIAESSIEKLSLLKTEYFYIFDKSLRYLKKSEREFILTNLK